MVVIKTFSREGNYTSEKMMSRYLSIKSCRKRAGKIVASGGT